MGLLDKIKDKKEAAKPSEVAAKPSEVEAKPSITINPPDGTPMDQLPEDAQELQPTDLKERVKAMTVKDLFTMHVNEVAALNDIHFRMWTERSPLALWHAEGRSTKRGEKPKKQEFIDDILLIDEISNLDCSLDSIIDRHMEKVEAHREAVPVLIDSSEVEDIEHDDSEWCGEQEDPLEDMPHTLFIGCIPRPNAGNRNSVGKMVWLEDYLKRYQDQVAESRSVPHYSMVEYAKGEKEVAALLRHDLRSDRPYLPRVLIADRRMAGSAAALEVLVQHYELVVERLG